MTDDGVTPDRVDQFVDDILGSPAALARLLDTSAVAGRSPLAGLRRPRIAFTGLGSSRFAALVVAAHLRSTGVTAWVEYPSATGGSAPATDLVLVAISASGRTPEVIDVVRAHHARSLVIGVTNDTGSPLAMTADIVLPLMAGTETAGIACRTFRATVATLAMMTGTASDDLRHAVEDIAIRIESGDRWLPAAVDAFDRAPSIDVLAGTALVGVAEQAALMLREAPRLPAMAYQTADWLHTGVYLALPAHRALLYPGDASDDNVRATIDRRGGQLVEIEPEQGSAIVRALVESVAAELVAAELWRRADAHDKVP